MNCIRAVGHLAVTAMALIGASSFATAAQIRPTHTEASAQSDAHRYSRNLEISTAVAKVRDPWLIADRYAIDDPDAAGSIWLSAVNHGSVSKKNKAQRAVKIAQKFRGTRYIWGGTTSRGFDCSGFVRYVYAKLGRHLPRTASEQFHCGKVIHYKNLRPGDILFFHTDEPGVSHVGIYIGNNRFIHAANPRKGVVVTSLNGYYAHRLLGARRVR